MYNRLNFLATPKRLYSTCKVVIFSFLFLCCTSAYLFFTSFGNRMDVLKTTSANPKALCRGLVTGIVRPANVSLNVRCGMSINVSGRLGNLMGQYATLYALSKANDYPPYIMPDMSKELRSYFNLSIATIEEDVLEFWKMRWQEQGLTDWMQPYFLELRGHFMYLTGYPNSWTFYHHIREEIVREFRFNDQIVHRTRHKLLHYGRDRKSTTFVGVHVRRGDYVDLMNGAYRGVVAHSGFFDEAMEYFNSKYSDAVFLVMSDDIHWCQENINKSRGNVFFEGADGPSQPIEDLALMAHCNHSIITIGTFGYWGAYLAGGETVYLCNYTLPDSPFLNVMHYDAFYLPEWIPMPADLTQFHEPSTTVDPSTA